MRTNTFAVYDFRFKTWTELEVEGEKPQPRAGHSAVVYNGKMYVFGGKDEDHEKLRDCWSFDLTANTWE